MAASYEENVHFELIFKDYYNSLNTQETLILIRILQEKASMNSVIFMNHKQDPGESVKL